MLSIFKTGQAADSVPAEKIQVTEKAVSRWETGRGVT